MEDVIYSIIKEKKERMGMLNQARKRGQWWCHIGILAIMGVSAWLTGCGQSGPLYHPGEQTPYGPPYYSIFHRPDQMTADSDEVSSGLGNSLSSQSSSMSCQTPSCQAG